MPAPVVAAIITAAVTATATGVQMNASRKAREGADNAADQQKRDTQSAIDLQNKKDMANLNQKSATAGASQRAALDAIRAAMSTSGQAGGTILTGPQGAAPAPTQGKTLLGA